MSPKLPPWLRPPSWPHSPQLALQVTDSWLGKGPPLQAEPFGPAPPLPKKQQATKLRVKALGTEGLVAGEPSLITGCLFAQLLLLRCSNLPWCSDSAATRLAASSLSLTWIRLQQLFGMCVSPTHTQSTCRSTLGILLGLLSTHSTTSINGYHS